MVSVFMATNAKLFWFQPSRCVTAILPCSVSRNTGGFTTSFSPGTAYTFQSNSYPRIFTFGHRNTCTRINFSPFPFFSLFFVFFFGGGPQVGPEEKRDTTREVSNNNNIWDSATSIGYSIDYALHYETYIFTNFLCFVRHLCNYLFGSKKWK